MVEEFSSPISKKEWWHSDSTIFDNRFWPNGSNTRYVVTWTTGGLTGGNCWGDDANEAVEAEDEPNLDALDNFLEKICPQITFLQYRRLMKNIVIRGNGETDYEYYGNYRTMGEKSFIYRELYDALVEKGLI